MRATISGHHCFLSPVIEGLEAVVSEQIVASSRNLPLPFSAHNLINSVFIHSLKIPISYSVGVMETSDIPPKGTSSLVDAIVASPSTP